MITLVSLQSISTSLPASHARIVLGKKSMRNALTLGKLVTERPVDLVGFDNVVEFNKNRQNDDNVVKIYKS
jgi:hypothetical protein